MLRVRENRIIQLLNYSLSAAQFRCLQANTLSSVKTGEAEDLELSGPSAPLHPVKQFE
jgi:hypothetical protein